MIPRLPKSSSPTVIEVYRPFVFDMVDHATGGVLLCRQVTQASSDTFRASLREA
jgi:hypothetical protein